MSELWSKKGQPNRGEVKWTEASLAGRSPRRFLARLASLIPPPRHPLVRYWLRFIATITEQPAITKILDAVGLPSHPPLPHARAPDPQLELDPVMSVA